MTRSLTGGIASRALHSGSILLRSAGRLLSEWALLLAIHLPRWNSNLRSAESRRLVRTPQQDSFRPANDTEVQCAGRTECSRTNPLPSEWGTLRGRRADAENIDLCRPFQTETLRGHLILVAATGFEPAFGVTLRRFQGSDKSPVLDRWTMLLVTLMPLQETRVVSSAISSEPPNAIR